MNQNSEPSAKEKKPLLAVIAGPTACGKSETAVELARRIGGEIISADSMQVYRHMDIGSAKITLEEQMGVPHFLIDAAEPDEEFDVVRYACEAKKALKDILNRGKIPILCGGTGFYIQAVTRDIDFEETGSLPEYRQELSSYADEHGNEALHEKLKAVDPASAEAIHPNNRKRVIRALEYFRETGRSIAVHNEEEKEKESPYDLHFFVLNDDRAALYERIDRRVDFMLAEGLVEEVQYLRSMGYTREMVSMQGLGYKEILDYLDGKTDYEEAVRILKRDTRHFAKRQITWFKREKDAVWIEIGDYGKNPVRIAEHLAECLGTRNGIHGTETAES
ncbi:MAG: tRNA (adenosine(37)-N6)-dimethylallyltransferase MiaA [Lachnospiraceae bacterium]|jgi:tRNA dimethylallyltransferase|nr:tRNA (adenosine(37)-N6)-dimethylallyltransferase MiaA [Lachnospiraceae bacterium]